MTKRNGWRQKEMRKNERLSPTRTDEQLIPVRVCFLDQLDLPLPPPSLERSLPARSFGRVVMGLEINEPAHPVFPGETSHHALAMLPRAPGEIAGHADIKHAMRPAREDIDPLCLRLSHVDC